MAKNVLLINVDIGETRVALIENGILAELYVERTLDRSPVGDVILGRVTRVLPGMQAAFIDIGLDRAAFLHVEDLLPPDDIEEGHGEEPATPVLPQKRISRKTPIRDVIREGQDLVVQVSKAPISTKGARVTSHIALPGRYIVYLPTLDHVGISRRIGSQKDRRRLKEVVESVRPPKGGVILRTAARDLTKKKLKADVGYLVKLWEETRSALETVKDAPALLHREQSIALRSVRDLFTEKVDSVIVDDRIEYAKLKQFFEIFLPERAEHLVFYDKDGPLFDEYGVEDEIARALSRKIPLPSGGHLIIDQAEALTAIDVNTGRFTGKGKDVEETILQTNLEAVKDIGYQLRFRNIGGLIVLDFIDMERASHRDRVYRELLEVLKRDKASTTVVRISELGLVEMTRKRTHESLSRTLYEPCFYCDGTSQLQSRNTVCHEIFRQMRREKDLLPGYEIVVKAHPAVCDMLQREERAAVEEAASRFQRRIVLQARKEYHLEQFDLTGN